MAFADGEGNVYDYPGLAGAFRSGRDFVPSKKKDLIPLPYGSYLFSLPGRSPVFYNPQMKDFRYVTVDPDGEEITAVASFPASGYLRTYLPAFERDNDSPVLPLWGYCGVAVIDGEFYIPAVRIDEDPRSDPKIHEDHDLLSQKISHMKEEYPVNSLVTQLSVCAAEYNCLCARNFFLGRFEAPVPSSRACNCRCLGCLSHQGEDSPFQCSQFRLEREPSPDEIARVICHHFEGTDYAVASFGQGCEGEPLLRGDDLCAAIGKVREKTGRGTINMNTNGSLPGKVRDLIDAGLDSIRVSLNSPTEKYYDRYHRPGNYSFSDVLKTVDTALEKEVFVSINLFFFPGFTDMESEVEALYSFLKKFPVDMIQTRNLNIDPDFYLDNIVGEEPLDRAVGIGPLITQLRRDFPNIKLGYYNPPLKK